MDVEVFVTPGLGDNSYLIGSGGEAVIVDPQRDAWRFLEVADRRGWRIRHVLETHVHNDYVSGAVEVRAAVGAEIVAPARGGYTFPHRAVAEGDEVAIGDIRIAAIETPGHTFEHLSWVVRDGGDRPVAVCTGGSLLVGSAGRSDLLGPDLAGELARLQYRSMERLADLPDDVGVLPTHGAGSFCVAALPSAARTSTLGEERAVNAALLAPDEETFVREQLAGLMRYPAYYANMAPLNRVGPRVLGTLPDLAASSPEQVASYVAEGATVIDGRDRDAFAEAHIPGSLNIELNEGFGSYVGWVSAFDAPLVLVLPEPEEEAAPEAVAQLVRIGYERLLGYLAGGIEAWRVAGREVRSYPLGTTRELGELVTSGEPVAVLDCRQPGEWEQEGTIPGSTLRFVGDLPGRVGELARDLEHWVICTNGHRAAIAASVLDAADVPVRLVARGGILGVLNRMERAGIPTGAELPGSSRSVGG